jgi:hypothetical protein
MYNLFSVVFLSKKNLLWHEPDMVKIKYDDVAPIILPNRHYQISVHQIILF